MLIKNIFDRETTFQSSTDSRALNASYSAPLRDGFGFPIECNIIPYATNGNSKGIPNSPVCDLKIDRDENAAINILALGLESLGFDRRSPTVLAVGE